MLYFCKFLHHLHIDKFLYLYSVLHLVNHLYILETKNCQFDILLVIVTPRVLKEDTRVMSDSEIHGGKLN